MPLQQKSIQSSELNLDGHTQEKKIQIAPCYHWTGHSNIAKNVAILNSVQILSYKVDVKVIAK